MSKLCSIALVPALLLSICQGTDVPPGPRPPVKTDLFQAGQAGYAIYRIPGIVVTRRGVVLAYCAARKNGIGDWADIDIALRRSLDGGKTWQPAKILVDAGKATTDNPTAIVDWRIGEKSIQGTPWEILREDVVAAREFIAK